MAVVFGTMESDNDVWHGPRDENGLPHGEGILVMEIGGKAYGTWVHGKQQGYGRVEFDTGTVYEGDIADDMYNGKGKIVSADSTYEGDWVDDQPHGFGTMTDYWGDVYVGEFDQGQYNGQGKLTCADGAIKEGYWEDGELVTATTDIPPKRYSMKDLWP